MSNASITEPGNVDLTAKGLLRLPDVLKIIPVSRSTWYLGVKNREYPAPVKIGRRASAWRRYEVEALLSRFTTAWPGQTGCDTAPRQ